MRDRVRMGRGKGEVEGFRSALNSLHGLFRLPFRVLRIAFHGVVFPKLPKLYHIALSLRFLYLQYMALV